MGLAGRIDAADLDRWYDGDEGQESDYRDVDANLFQKPLGIKDPIWRVIHHIHYAAEIYKSFRTHHAWQVRADNNLWLCS